jgi:hypothetical protein
MGRTSEWLKELKVGEPQTSGQLLRVFPLVAKETNGRDYLTLDEAFNQSLIFIPESGNVPEIVVVVKGEKPVLVVEGEVVVGGLQNRTINISLLLEAGKEHRIPVSCIERGRWSTRRFHSHLAPRENERAGRVAFSIADHSAHSRLRRKKTASTTMNLVLACTATSDQSEVWREVRDELRTAGVFSATEDATSFFEFYRASIEDLVNSIVTVKNQVGAIICIAQSIAGIEVFDHPESWQILSRKILYGYAAEALEFIWHRRFSNLVSYEEAKAFRDMVAAMLERAMVRPSPVGMGEHHLLNGTVSGFALVYGGKVIHLFAFPESYRW